MINQSQVPYNDLLSNECCLQNASIHSQKENGELPIVYSHKEKLKVKGLKPYSYENLLARSQFSKGVKCNADSLSNLF